MTVTIVVLRPLTFCGQRVEPGVELDLDPLQAAHMLDSGRARLLRQGDATAVAAARKAETDETMRLMNRSHAYTNPHGPWVQR